MEPVESPRLEAVEYGGVCTLGLTVALGVRWRCIADLGAHLLAKLNKGRACELCTIVGDDTVGDAEPYEDAKDELHSCCCGNLPIWLSFRPLKQLIDVHKTKLVT